VDKVGQVFSEYLGFPCQFSFHRLLHTHHLQSGTGTIGQVIPTYQVDPVSSHPKKLKDTKFYFRFKLCEIAQPNLQNRLWFGYMSHFFIYLIFTFAGFLRGTSGRQNFLPVLFGIIQYIHSQRVTFILNIRLSTVHSHSVLLC
jgi:hypothetical protein